MSGSVIEKSPKGLHHHHHSRRIVNIPSNSRTQSVRIVANTKNSTTKFPESFLKSSKRISTKETKPLLNMANATFPSNTDTYHFQAAASLNSEMGQSDIDSRKKLTSSKTRFYYKFIKLIVILCCIVLVCSITFRILYLYSTERTSTNYLENSLLHKNSNETLENITNSLDKKTRQSQHDVDIQILKQPENNFSRSLANKSVVNFNGEHKFRIPRPQDILKDYDDEDYIYDNANDDDQDDDDRVAVVADIINGRDKVNTDRDDDYYIQKNKKQKRSLLQRLSDERKLDYNIRHRNDNTIFDADPITKNILIINNKNTDDDNLSKDKINYTDIDNLDDNKYRNSRSSSYVSSRSRKSSLSLADANEFSDDLDFIIKLQGIERPDSPTASSDNLSLYDLDSD